MRSDWVAWWVAAAVALGFFIALWLQLSTNTRLSRRRKKNHSRIIQKSRGPSVRFSVKPPKK